MITAVKNSRIKNLAELHKKPRARKEQGVFLTEGTKMFLEAPRERIREVYISESFSLEGEVNRKLQETGYEVVTEEVFKKISDTITPQGILCVVQQMQYQIEDFINQENPLLILLEGLQDPGNVGTILRTGEGAGITGVIMSKETVDIYNPKTIRATMGSIYRVPFVYADDIKSCIRLLQKKEVLVYAAHLNKSQDYDTYSYRSGTAFLIGNEGKGLSDDTTALADQRLRIPMQGELESLNASVSAAVLMYEANRQRRLEEIGISPKGEKEELRT